MPGFLVQQGATVLCLHGGQATPAVPNPRVTSNGQPLIVMSGQAVCAPPGTPLLPLVTQTRVIAT